MWLTSRTPADTAPGTPPPTTTSATHAPASPVLTTVSSPPFVSGRTYIQTVHTPEGARTFTDPYGPVGEGQRVPNGTSVEVSCKIVAPGGRTVGVYWYRIASPPWNDQYYSPANSWLNTDPPAGPYTSVVDAAVPYCP